MKERARNVEIHRRICLGETRTAVANDYSLTTGRICQIYNRLERMRKHPSRIGLSLDEFHSAVLAWKPPPPEPTPVPRSMNPDWLLWSIEEIANYLPIRAINALRNDGFLTVGDIARAIDSANTPSELPLRRTPNVGRVTIQKFDEWMLSHGKAVEVASRKGTQ